MKDETLTKVAIGFVKAGTVLVIIADIILVIINLKIIEVILL
jgi:hypothetical protein